MVRVALFIGGLLFCALAAPLSVIARAPEPVGGGPILVISLNAATHVAAAQGDIIGPREAPLAVLAHGDPGFAQRLLRTDAWLVVDGQWVANICGVSV